MVGAFCIVSMTNLCIAWRWLRREWRAGDLRVISLALLIAVASIVSVTAFTDRVRLALARQGAELLGADLVLESAFTPDLMWQQLAQQQQLQTSTHVSFRSMALSGERNALAEVKAVEDDYPLRGQLRIADSTEATDIPANGIPKPGEVWLDRQLLALLDVAPGNSIQLGDSEFVVTKLLVFEPDRAISAFSIAPRLLMNSADLVATGLVQPGSLMRYRFLVAGDELSVATFKDQVQSLTGTGVRLRDAEDAGPRFRLALQRAERFLGLAALVSVLLSGVAIVRAARHFTERHLDAAAVLRCLGASQTTITVVFMTVLVLLGLVASVAGAAAGYVGQMGFTALLPATLQIELPPPSFKPLFAGLVFGMVVLGGFSSPTLLRLRNVPTLRVLRRELGALPAHLWPVYILAAICVGALILWIVRDGQLGSVVFLGSVATLIVLAVVCFGVLKLLNRMRRYADGPWRYGLANLVRRSQSTMQQAVGLGLGIMAMLLLTLVRNDLLQTWEKRLPPETPNHFLINIQTDQREALTTFMQRMNLNTPVFSPLVRARLTKVNGTAVSARDFADPVGQQMVQRAANLTWSEELADDNKVIAGQWWGDSTTSTNQVSVEQDYAQHLGVALGDVLSYQIGDREINLEITSLRTVSWDSFRPNFFLVTPPAVLRDAPVSYIASVYVPENNTTYLGAMLREFPNVTDLDVGVLLTQVRRLLERLNQALEFIFLFTLVAGLLVLYASIYTSYDERRREMALLRTVGAQGKSLRMALLVEFGALGLLAGVIGALGASVTGYAVAEWVLQLDYLPRPSIWWAGLISGILLVASAGLLMTRRLSKTPPWVVLRQTI